MKIIKFARLFVMAAGIALFSSCSKQEPEKTGITPSQTLKVVRFANLPYADHTFSVIGLSNGWFKDVGIDLRITTIKAEEVIPGLANGAFDVASVPPGMLFSAYNSTTNLCSFVFSDLFQGYALMAQPRQGLKSYADFIEAGMNHSDAVAATVKQIEGKRFAYPSETAIKPFIDRLLTEGNLTRDNFKNLVLDDPLTVNTMRNKQADFQVGGVPSRITLQKEGFVALISSVDLAKGAKPSAESTELASILQNGWATTKKNYQENLPTLLRLAAVNYRIMAYMRSNRQEALRVHMRFLSQVTGQTFTTEDGKVIYDELNPFWTFEQQKEWFHNKNNSLFYAHVNGAILNSFIADNVFKGRPPTVEDVIYADDTYFELERLMVSAQEIFRNLDQKSLSPTATEKLTMAREHFDAYNFYDAERLAKEVLKEVTAQK